MKYGLTGTQSSSLAGAHRARLTPAALFLLSTALKREKRLLVFGDHKGPVTSFPHQLSVCRFLCSLRVILPSKVFAD